MGVPLVSIVIPTFNKVELTKQCLAALPASTAVPYEVIVADDASTDGTRELLLAEQEQGRLRAVLSAENIGFGKACNAGAAAARGTFVLLLNNDTIPHAGWLEALVETLEVDPSIGLVGARLLYGDGTIQHAGVTFAESLRTFHVFRGAPADHPAVLEPRDYPAVTGACVLLRRTLWEELGGLDEGYRHYVEDIDLCMRVWAAGLRVRYCPRSVVTHLEQQSAPSRAWVDELVEAGWRRFHARWGSRWPEGVRAISPVPLPEGTRAFSVVAVAEDLIRDPALLESYATRFAEDDDATLVVFDPERDGDAVAAALGPALEVAGLGEHGPDMLVFGRRLDGDVILSLASDAVLADGDVPGALGRLPRFGRSQLDELRQAAESAWATAA